MPRKRYRRTDCRELTDSATKRKRFCALQLRNENANSQIRAGAILSRVLSDGADCVTPAELAAAIVLQRQGTIVIMEACKLSSRRRVATTACAVLPTPGIVG